MGKRINLFLLTISFILFSLSTLVLAVDCPFPDTGQTKCYDANGNEINPCPQPGQTFYGQDAQYPCNPHSYTKLDANGNDLPDNATEWVMIRDNVTGLIWENKTDDGSINDKDYTYTWQNAQDVFIATLNSHNFGGYSDWRLPTIMELSFLVDRYRYDPSINTTYFPNTVSSGYWSSTTYASYPDLAWIVDFYSGRIHNYYKSNSSYVRAVRSGQCGSFGNFVANGDGTVTDTDTGLMWQQATAPGAYTWQQALSYCENLTLAGYPDWRLPSVNELQSIVDYSRYDPAINTDYFPNTAVLSDYWSSTTCALYPDSAWVVGFYYGGIYYGLKSGTDVYVRAVRSGQCGSLITTTTSTIPQPCVSESLYGEHSQETELLRYLRDNVLSTTPEGQEIIRLYYEWSSVIVKEMEENEDFKQDVKEMVDGIMTMMRGKEE